MLGEILEGRRSGTIFAISQQIQTMLEEEQAICMAGAMQFDYISRLLEPLQEGKSYIREPSSGGADDDGLTASTDSEKATMLAKVFFPLLPLTGLSQQ